MILEFIQRAEDLIDFNKSHMGAGSLGIVFKIFPLFLIVALIMNFLLMVDTEGYSNELLMDNLTIILIVLGVYVLIKFGYPYMIKRAFAKNKDSGERRIEFLDEEFTVTTNQVKSTFKWTTVSKLKESDKSYFLYIAEHQAIIIPKRIFKEYDEKEFVKIIEQKIK